MLNRHVYALARQIIRQLRAYGPAGRNIEVFNDDIYIVSYPKSGNTWVRFMLGNLYSQADAVTFSNLEQRVPDIYQNSSRTLSKLPRPRILKSHEYLDPRYRKVIYIVRDPRDVAVSYYHFLIKMRVIADDYPLADYIDRFIGGELDPFGSWHDHAGGWIGARQGRGDFLLLRYEEMLDNPVRELRKVTEFIGHPVTGAQVEAAVAMSSFERMRTMEQQEGSQWAAIKSGLTDKPFIRKGQKGAWRTELPIEAIDRIESAWSGLMLDLGYAINKKQGRTP